MGDGYLFAPVEEPLPIRCHPEHFMYPLPELFHLGEFGKGVHSVRLFPIHAAHLNPHCGCTFVKGQAKDKITNTRRENGAKRE